MNRQDNKSIMAVMLGAFSLLSGLAQTLSLPPIFSISTLLLTLIFGFGAVWFFYRSNLYLNTVRKISKLGVESIPSQSEDRARYIEDEAELRTMWELDKSVYGTMSISFELFRGWWRRYQKGSFVIIRDNKIVASVGIWPMKKTVFEDFVNGRRKEQEVTNRSLYSHSENFKCSTWYISGIVLTEKVRGTKAIRKLLIESIHHWLQSGHVEFPVQVCALAYSKDGENLLKKFGFHRFLKAEDMADHCPLYILSIKEANEVQTWILHFKETEVLKARATINHQA